MNIHRPFERLHSNIKRLLKHTLYIKLVILLFCITFTVVLMQAGSLFLLDYIPSNRHALLWISQQQQNWQHLLDIAPTQQDFETTLLHMDSHQQQEMQEAVSWLDGQDDKELRHIMQKLRVALSALTNAQHAAMGTQLLAIQNVILAYKALAHYLEKDAELKQSVIALLQLVSLFLVISCLGAIAFGARKLLIDRINTLLALVPQEFHSLTENDTHDELARLELVVYELSARLEGFRAEHTWFNQTSSERLRRIIRAQEFLHQFVASVNNNSLSETSLRKGLFLLQNALNINNVILMFNENDLAGSTERVLFSHHKPVPLNTSWLDELTTTNFVRVLITTEDATQAQYQAVGFTSPSGALGVLIIEADVEHVFDETETQLLEMTAQLLSMVMGFQGREQEGRRLALLEERAAIARELHDSLAQSLSFMKIQISRLQTAANGPVAFDEMRDIVNELRAGLDNAYRELRELLATFRVHMDVRGLNAAIQSAIDEFSQRSNLSITLDNRLVNCRLTVNEEFHILHVIREALSNVVRHASASSVQVALVFHTSGTMMVTIDDDGIGYTAQEDGLDHYGQSIMKERAYSLGGDVAVMRRRQGGTRVRLIFTPKLPQ